MLRDRQGLEQAYQETRWRAYEKDPALFFQECVWIPSQRDPRGREQFELYDYQEEDFETLINNRFVIGLKSRQIGWSTLIAAALLHRCIFRPGSVCLWVSNNQDNANKAIGMLNLMWGFLPPWVKERAPEMTKNQEGGKEWTFPDGVSKSRLRALPGTATAGASETASIVVLDEFGLVDANLQDDLFRSTDPTTDAGGSLWILSTARGAYNRFATMFKDARAGLADEEIHFVSMFRPWVVSRFVNRNANDLMSCEKCKGSGVEPGTTEQVCSCVDLTIYNRKKRQFKEKPWKFHAEYPLTPEEAFRESGNPRFSGLPREEDCFDEWVSGYMKSDGFGAPVFVVDDTGPFHIRADVYDQLPQDTHPYVMFVDPSRGAGGDYMAAHVVTFDDEGPDIVAWWHTNMFEAIHAARQFDLIGRWFSGDRQAALLAVESAGAWGDSILNELQNHLHYPNLYRDIVTGSTRRRPVQRVGFAVHKHNRPRIIDRLAEFMSDEKIVGHIHPKLRHELGTLVVTEDGKVQADVGTHDDLVMSLAGALWLLIELKRVPSQPSEERPETPRPANSIKGLLDRIERDRVDAEAAASKGMSAFNRMYERQNRRRRGRG